MSSLRNLSTWLSCFFFPPDRNQKLKHLEDCGLCQMLRPSSASCVPLLHGLVLPGLQHCWSMPSDVVRSALHVAVVPPRSSSPQPVAVTSPSHHSHHAQLVTPRHNQPVPHFSPHFHQPTPSYRGSVRRQREPDIFWPGPHLRLCLLLLLLRLCGFLSD